MNMSRFTVGLILGTAASLLLTGSASEDAWAQIDGSELLARRLPSSTLVDKSGPSFSFMQSDEEAGTSKQTTIPLAIGPVSLLNEETEPDNTWRYQPHYLEFTQGLRPVEDYDANRRLRPDELALLMQNEYGRGSILARSALTLATVASAAERGSQIPLDQVNVVTARVVSETGNLFGLESMPELRLRSEIDTDRVMIGFKTRW